MTPHRGNVLVAILVTISGLTQPQTLSGQDATVVAGETVLLTFAWPMGMTAEVDLERYQWRQSDGDPDSSIIQLTYQMNVSEHEQGRLISYTDFAAPNLVDVSEGELGLMRALASVVPSYIVNEGGELVEVVGLDETLARMRGWLKETLDSLQESDPGELLDQFLNKQTLFAAAADEWNALVGVWVDAEFEIGVAYELEAEEPMPLLGNVPVMYRYEMGITGRVPCHADTTDSLCVELILQSFPDPESLGPHLEAFVERMMESAGAPEDVPSLSYEDMQIENEIVLIAEPNGLIPHALSITKSTEMLMRMGDVEQTATDVRITQFAFRYRR